MSVQTVQPSPPTIDKPAAKPPRAATKQKTTETPAPALLSYDGKPIDEESIRYCAYLKWEAAGRPQCDGVGFWLDAERDILDHGQP